MKPAKISARHLLDGSVFLVGLGEVCGGLKFSLSSYYGIDDIGYVIELSFTVFSESHLFVSNLKK